MTLIQSAEASFADNFRNAFREISEGATDNPLVNPVRALASELFLALENGEITNADIVEAVEALEQDGFENRTRAFHDKGSDSASVDQTFASLADLSFDDYRDRIENTPVGVVFTAHPTFALTGPRRELLAAYPADGDAEALAEWRAALAQTPSGPPKAITLSGEHEDVLVAIDHAQTAIAKLNRRVLEHARKTFPERWRELRPAPVSLASWVGYDLDGRTDIHWGQSITIRLTEKARQLDRYVAALDEMGDAGSDSLTSLHEELDAAAQAAHRHADLFSGDLTDPEIVVPAANALTGDEDGRLVSLAGAIETLSDAIANEDDDERALSLSLLRSQMQAYGLGVSRIHLRVNAAQVRSALRSDLGLDPDKDYAGRSALNVASSKAKTTRPREVNFGSVFLEQMTARRQFMMCAQILKHIDAETPIRFLIAECEAPATVMGAIYLARLYGVEEKLDISPLFETPQALEGGGRFIERLLDEPEYRTYVRKRGRMAIQIGYSDSGRFMGQATSSLASERLQVLFAKALGAARLDEVEALVFNTHGESMGRGAYPGDYRGRVAHLSSPWVRSRFRRENVPLSCEYSFQGGEGFLHFQTPALASRAVDALWALSMETPPPDFSDRFYEDINFSWDFYRALKAWQEALYDRDDYRDVIFSFAQHLLFKTGSRETKRPRQGAGPPEIRSIRAIPHNAILQQLAAPVNVSGGIGAAAGREVDRFIDHVSRSGRMKDLLAMTTRARALTSISILRAYSGLFSPSYWSSLAGMARRTPKSEAYEAVLQTLQQEKVAFQFARLTDFLARDLRAYDAILDGLDDVDPAPRTTGVSVDLGVLHAIRQALIGRAASLAAQAPAFSRRHDVDRSDIIEMALDLRLDEAAEIMRRIFPKESPTKDLMVDLEEPIDAQDADGGAYPDIHDNIIDPLTDISAALRKLTSAVANHYGAFG